MRDGLVPSLALKLPETITYYACLSFFTGELWGKRRELTARPSPVRTWYCQSVIHAIFSTAFIEKRGARHWPGRSHRSPAAAGQSQCGRARDAAARPLCAVWTSCALGARSAGLLLRVGSWRPPPYRQHKLHAAESPPHRGGSRETRAGPVGRATRATRLGPRRRVKSCHREGPTGASTNPHLRQRVSWEAS